MSASTMLARHVAGDLRAAGVIMAVSAMIGFAVNFLRPSGLPFTYQAADERLAASVASIRTENAPGEIAMIDLDSAVIAFDRGDVVFIDAREKGFFQLGHVPGARNLSQGEFVREFPAVAALRERSVIVYCSETDCDDSLIVAKALKRLGFEAVSVMVGGWTEWTASRLPVESGGKQ